MSKTDYRSLFGKTHLGSWDLQDKDVTVTITAVQGDELTLPGGKKNKRPVLSLKGTDKKLVCGATMCKTIKTMYGPFIEDWPGKRITLYKTTTQNSEGEIECIRIRPQIPPAKNAANEEATNVTPLPGAAG